MKTPKPTHVTYASLIMTDGEEAVIGIYVGAFRGPRGRRWINRHNAREVGRERLPKGAKMDYQALAAPYATADAPVVDWSL